MPLEIKLFNSMSGTKVLLQPTHDKKVNIYYCGPTVYNFVHIGNLRPAITFDILKRFLTAVGYDVTLVSNYTDIDDKIIKQAREQNKSEKEIADYYIAAYEADNRMLNNLPLDFKPRVTETMPEIIQFISDLISQGYAYEVNGDVYFRVSKIEDYGRLSKINIDDLIVGSRIEENSQKEDPLDFALWKKTTVGITFQSPFGEGRPGWHTECVVMIHKIFKSTPITIHGGGFDLKFPHHENELAQCEACYHHDLADIWMHNGFINFNDEKMSKSLGNVKLVKDMVAQFSGNIVRYAIFGTQYRAPINFTDESLDNCRIEVEKIETAFRQAYLKLALLNKLEKEPKEDELDLDGFYKAMADDLNISNALAELFRVCKEANQLVRTKEVDFKGLNKIYFTLSKMIYILGLQFELPVVTEEILSLYANYLKARETKDFNKSDELRVILQSYHVL